MGRITCLWRLHIVRKSVVPDWMIVTTVASQIFYKDFWETDKLILEFTWSTKAQEHVMSVWHCDIGDSWMTDGIK